MNVRSHLLSALLLSLVASLLPALASAQLNAVFANNARVNQVCLGDGSGSLSCSGISLDTNSSRDVALGPVEIVEEPVAITVEQSGIQ